MASPRTTVSSGNENLLTAVKIEISMNEIKLCRKVRVKGLYGSVKKIQKFIEAYKKDLF